MIRIHLSRLLGELKWTQAELARRTGIRPSTINEMYHEIIERINIEHLDKICEALNCTLDELIEYIPNSRKK
ncbi:MAG: helix-turn-helix domain-containing protein [Clostridiaceae bacterium]